MTRRSKRLTNTIAKLRAKLKVYALYDLIAEEITIVEEGKHGRKRVASCQNPD